MVCNLWPESSVALAVWSWLVAVTFVALRNTSLTLESLQSIELVGFLSRA